VGTMHITQVYESVDAVHPHGRGDNQSADAQESEPRGSPPRAWGQCCRLRLRNVASRFTPTGVGTIVAPHTVSTNAAVHPHGRGDNCIYVEPDTRRVGSPPRAWGQLFQRSARRAGHRFTPTGVGTMTSRRSSGWCTSVHPHGRGDNATVLATCRVVFGSPPRAWGQYRHAE